MTETLNDSQSESPGFKRELFDDFERLANHSQDAIYHYDIASQRFLFHNQKFQIFLRLENQTESIMTLDQVLQASHPEDRQQLRQAFNKLKRVLKPPILNSLPTFPKIPGILQLIRK